MVITVWLKWQLMWQLYGAVPKCGTEYHCFESQQKSQDRMPKCSLLAIVYFTPETLGPGDPGL